MPLFLLLALANIPLWNSLTTNTKTIGFFKARMIIHHSRFFIILITNNLKENYMKNVYLFFIAASYLL